MQKREKKEKRNFVAMPSAFHIEADKTRGGISVSVSGVISIPDFTENSALIRVRGRRIKIRGKALSVAVYENRIAEIIGDVEGIDFL